MKFVADSTHSSIIVHRMLFSTRILLLPALLSMITIFLFFSLEISYGISLEEFAREKAKIENLKDPKNTRHNPKQVMEKVNRFCNLLQRTGITAFQIAMDRDSQFFDSETYVFAHTLIDAKVMADPIHPEKVGLNVLYAQDTLGKFYIAEMNRMVREKKAGWVEYYYRRSGIKEPIVKTVYACECSMNEISYVIAGGLDNFTKNQVLKMLGDVNADK